MKIVVLASGRGSNLTSLLEKISAGLVQATVALVVSDQLDAGGLKTAQEFGIDSASLPREVDEGRKSYDERLLDLVQAAKPDLIVLAGFMRILTPTFVEAFAGRIINIHPSLLPKHKGAHGVRDTLASGDDRAGCTVHYVTSDLDGGPIIMQASVAVLPNDTLDELQSRVLAVEHWLLPRTIQLIAEDRVAPDGSVAPGDSWSYQPIPNANWPEGF